MLAQPAIRTKTKFRNPVQMEFRRYCNTATTRVASTGYGWPGYGQVEVGRVRRVCTHIVWNIPESSYWQQISKVPFNVPTQKKHHIIKIYGGLGHAMAQDVSHWPVTV